jgi:hypothetical protein
MKFITKNSKLVLGSLTLGLTSILATGCSGDSEPPKVEQQVEGQNKILTIVEKQEGQYVITDEANTSGPNKAIITDINGTTQVLNEEEMKKFAEAEMQKVENNTSNLTSATPPASEGLSMGEVLLAGAAGALLGSVIVNMLSSNSNYQSNQQQYNRSSSYQSRMGGGKTSSTGTSKSSFFGGSSSASSSSNSASSSSSASSSTSSKPSLTKSSSSTSSSKSGFFGG